MCFLFDFYPHTILKFITFLKFVITASQIRKFVIIIQSEIQVMNHTKSIYENAKICVNVHTQTMF